jgi:NAD(P)-dependent dehydrogenase (short-subunit alcohol dehydrogenase family)
MMFNYTDRVVIVTGAAGTLGEATARAFYEAGAKLVLVDLKLEAMQSTYGDTLAEDRRLYVAVDLTNADQVNGMVGKVMQHYGRIDVLANIAGGFTMGPPVHETDEKTWDFMLNLNAKTAFLTCRAVVPQMLAAGGGKIINVGARAGLQGSAKMAPYIVSKSAVIRLTESLAAELKHKGINVNCILPGTIDTPANRESMPNADFEKWVPPSDLASVILFLASPVAKAVQGAAVPVYGRS